MNMLERFSFSEKKHQRLELEGCRYFLQPNLPRREVLQLKEFFERYPIHVKLLHSVLTLAEPVRISSQHKSPKHSMFFNELLH